MDGWLHYEYVSATFSLSVFAASAVIIINPRRSIKCIKSRFIYLFDVTPLFLLLLLILSFKCARIAPHSLQVAASR